MDDRLEFHVPFLEAAVQAVVDADSRASAYHREREPVYAIEDPEARDRAFGRLAAEWFHRLALDAPIRQALRERAADLARARRILVGPAARAHDAGAELLVPPDGPPTIVIRIRPDQYRDPPALLAFLRRELLHIADMLDPDFHYEPRLPPQPAGPAHDRLIQDRYRLLWDCSVDGRLLRAGLLPGAVRHARRRDYRRTFGDPGPAHVAARGRPAGRAPSAAPAFGTIFHGPRPSHPDLVDIAARRVAGTAPGHRCSLCGFPTISVDPDPAGLPPPVLDTIRSEFPGWSPGAALCIQCADLYRARGVAAIPDTDSAAVATSPADSAPQLECRR
jgi:hypothetical protein